MSWSSRAVAISPCRQARSNANCTAPDNPYFSRATFDSRSSVMRSSLTTSMVLLLGRYFAGETTALDGIDVEMNGVKRQIAFAVLAHNFFDERIGVITPAALLVSQGPHRRQRQ